MLLLFIYIFLFVQNISCFLLNNDVSLKERKCKQKNFLLPLREKHTKINSRRRNSQRRSWVLLNSTTNYDFNIIEKKWQIIWNSHQMLDADFEKFNQKMSTRKKKKKKERKLELELELEREREREREREGERRNDNGEDITYLKEVKKDVTSEGNREKKFYVLDMFPYPSAEGLHVGHILCFTITDIISKFKKMNNFCVFHPIGWDSFGLPCDRLSMKLKKNPKIIIKKNIRNFKEQLLQLGFLFNWISEINTSDKKYFKWTQWIIIQMFLKKLAYRKKSYVNWSHLIKCVISNDELKQELNMRHFADAKDLKIEKVKLLQWYLRITKYAKRLLADLQNLDWPQNIKNIQKKWIGEKRGIVIKTKLINFNNINIISCNINNKYNYKIVHGVSQPFSPISIYFLALWLCYDNEVQKDQLVYDVRETSESYRSKQYGCFTKFTSVQIEDEDGDENEDESEKHKGTDQAMVSGCSLFFKRMDRKYIRGELLLSNMKKEQPSIQEEGRNESDDYVNIFLEENEAFLENDKIVVSVSHPHIKKIINNDKNLLEFVNQTVKENDTYRLKNDILYFTGSYIFNPIANKHMPIYVCAFILDHHKKYLFVKIKDCDDEKENEVFRKKRRREIYELLYNSGFTKKKKLYNLRDWLFSRQRYWGEPFPFLYKTKQQLEHKLKGEDICTHENKSKEGMKKETNEKIFIDNDIPLCLPKFDKKIYEQDKLEKLKSISLQKTKPHPILSRFKKWTFVEKNNILYKRECNIMPQWAGSSWYYLRYLDSKNDKKIFSKKIINWWLPVDLYVGGSEHAVLHLLYARFFHKFLYDLKLVKQKEPFQKLFNQGLLLNISSFSFFTNLKNRPVSVDQVKPMKPKYQKEHEIKVDENENNKSVENIPKEIADIIENNTFIWENNHKKFLVEENSLIHKDGKYFLKGLEHIEVQPNFEKMSKSRGNTVNPNDLVKTYGADCLRLHILFLGPIDQNKKWTLHGIKGCFNFLRNVYAHFLEKTKAKKTRNKEKEEYDDTNIKGNNDINFICIKCIRQNKCLIRNYQKIITPNMKKQKQKIEECIELLQKNAQPKMQLSRRIKKKKEINIEVNKKERTNFYIKAITNCIETMKLNTAVSFFMKFFNEIKQWDTIPLKIFLIFIKLLYPFSPHLSEELHFYYLKKYKKKLKKEGCYLCNSKWLLYYEKWPVLFKVEETEQIKTYNVNRN